MSVAFESRGGEIGPPIVLDDAAPLGRVDAARDPVGRVWVSWLAVRGEVAEVVAQAVGPTGILGERLVLGRTSARRVSGVPRLEAVGDGLVAIWLEDAAGEPVRLRGARVRATSGS